LDIEQKFLLSLEYMEPLYQSLVDYPEQFPLIEVRLMLLHR
jgi:hypothetical protein